MAESGSDTNLETLLNNAINPSKKTEDWDAINEFADQINKEYEGPQVACRLLTHKIQSPQEWEAMLALTVAEACVKNCGRRFHSEVGKFRFLNEIIKVVSPKYLGTRSSAKVKQKCVESLYCWKKGLPTEPKIAEAYDMLKRQGIITEDPTYLDETIPSFAQRPKSILFDDQEKEDLLSRLLKSKDPEDLQAANRLIKNLVKKDEQRMERVSRRITELDKINTNISVLTDMLNQYDAQTTSQADKDLMKELFDSLESLRPALFRLASDADDKDDEGLKDVLQANDAVVKVLDEYKRLVEGNYTPTENLRDVDLVDLLGHEITTPARTSESMSLLDLDFEKLGLNDSSMIPLSPPAVSSSTSGAPSFNSVIPNVEHYALPSYPPPPPYRPVAAPVVSHPAPSLQDQRSAFDDINGFQFFQFNAASSVPKSNPPPPVPPAAPPTLASIIPAAHPAVTALAPAVTLVPAATLVPAVAVPVQFAASSSPPAIHVAPLTDLTVRLEDIQPSSLPSRVIYDKNQIKILLHFAANVPRDDVRVLVISASSQHTVPVKSVVFQGAVPKNMKIKLQPPTGTELPAYNPILPQAAITQVLLLANPNQEKVRLKFKVSYSMNGVTQNDVGDVEAFPDWSALNFS